MSIDMIVRLFLVVQPLIRKEDEVSYAPYDVFTINPMLPFRHLVLTRWRRCVSIWSREPETAGGGSLTLLISFEWYFISGGT